MPAPQAYSIVLKYGIALNTDIMLSGKVHDTAVVGGVELMPAKKPFKKLKIQASGLKSMEKKLAMFVRT
jgi:hypothetical protein